MVGTQQGGEADLVLNWDFILAKVHQPNPPCRVATVALLEDL